MGREKGWVSVSVRTYHSHRSREQQQQQRVMQQDYTVDETGATLNAVARTASAEEEERLMEQMQQQAGQTTTSIFIRDWKVRHSHTPKPGWLGPVFFFPSKTLLFLRLPWSHTRDPVSLSRGA